jgi:adenylate cyclase
MEDRRHIAVMFTDIVGYTALMGSDEDKAFDMLKRNHTIHETLIKRHKGKLIKEVGDGTLASFPLASDAVRCAMDIQREAKSQQIPLKIGIHEGEMVMAGADVLGDGVNVASRLQELSQEGCITISGRVYTDVKNKAGINTKFIGDKTLKGVDDPVKVYEVLCKAKDELEGKIELPPTKSNKLFYYIIAGIVVVIIAFFIWQFIPTQEKDTTPNVEETVTVAVDRSIAVLPFANLSDDPEQEYFSDGMMDEILMHLYKIGDLEVTSRTSAMRYRNSDKLIGDIANELGVRHVLEGSVRKEGDRVRITVQLIDAVSDKHIWAESYDEELKSVFAIQSDVAQQIARALKAEISPEVKERMEKIPTKSMDAYDMYLEANSLPFGNERSIELLEQAIKFDPEFADAYVYLGFRKTGRAETPKEAENIAYTYCNKALEIDANNYSVYKFLIYVYLWYKWEFEKAMDAYKKVKELHPNNYEAYTDLLVSMGKAKEAVREVNKEIKLDPLQTSLWGSKILSLYFAGEHNEAIKTIESVIKAGLQNYRIDRQIYRIHLYSNMYEDIIREIDTIYTVQYSSEFQQRALSSLAIAYYHTGQAEKSHFFLNKLIHWNKKDAYSSPAFYTAMIYAQMGETDLAFEYLEKAYDAHEVEMYWLKVEPPFEPLHDDPRWQVMLDKVGFPH